MPEYTVPTEWFVDCYSFDRLFPMNSYGPHTIEECFAISRRLLTSAQSGILEVRIVPESIGCSPVKDETLECS